MNDLDWHWADDVHQHFRHAGITQVAYVPDGGLAKLIQLCNSDETIRSVALTTEEEGVAQIAGAWLGGQRGVFLTQSGGVGNCVNMLSMVAECRIPFFCNGIYERTMGGDYTLADPNGAGDLGGVRGFWCNRSYGLEPSGGSRDGRRLHATCI